MRREVALTLLAGMALGCSRTTLYVRGDGHPPADRLALGGEVCTTDATEASFPVRVVFLVDTANGPLFSEFDPSNSRVEALSSAVSQHTVSGDFAFSIVSFGARPRVHTATDAGGFTQGASELQAALGALTQPEACLAGVCRDYGDGLDLARSVIEGDIAQLDAGDRVRTQYAVVLLAGGAPLPLTDPWDETIADFADSVVRLRERVEDAGALSFRMHTVQLGADNVGVDDRTASMLQQAAFVGGGRYEQFLTPDAISFDRFGLLKLTELLEGKSLLVSNRAAVAAVGDTVRDRDMDGLSDEAERNLGTDPDLPDTDRDGFTDLVELLVSTPPREFTDPPSFCVDLGAPPWGDADEDGLNDCEERLTGTEVTLPDTDGDGVPDRIEVVARTNYLEPDLLEDVDWDGANNGLELLQHTDPISSDATAHLGSAYRYDVEDLGVKTTPRLGTPYRITGVSTVSGGGELAAGVGTLSYTPEPPSLQWQAPLDEAPGPVVDVSEGGRFELASGVDGRHLRVDVDATLLAFEARSEQLLVELSERNCWAWTVRNVALAPGDNTVEVWFAEAPRGRPELAGTFRRALIDVTYDEASGRVPSDPLLTVLDEEFLPVGGPR